MSLSNSIPVSVIADNMKKAGWVIGSFVICASLAGCGGSSNGPATLQIQLSPSAPSLAINSSVLVTAQTTPSLPAHMSTMTWSVGNFSTQCTEGVTGDPSMAPPMPGCPDGWIAYGITPSEFPPEAAYYYSPATPGTYQISVQGQIMNGSQQVTYQGSTNATVTVTAQ